MGGKIKYKEKLNMLLILYAGFVTLTVLILGFVMIVNLSNPDEESNRIYLSYTDKEINNALYSGSMQLRLEELPKRVVNLTEMKSQYNNELLVKYSMIMGSVFVVVMALSLGVSKYMSRKIINPIEKIVMKLPYLDACNTEEISETIFTNELQGIRDTLLDTKAKIHMLINEANCINAYITHEQKNALAVLRAKVQLGEKDELISLIDKMNASLDDILALNATVGENPKEEVDLSLVCAEVVDIYVKLYKEIYLEIDEEEMPLIQGKGLWIYRAVCNLVENAMKYGENSKITVRAFTQNGSAIISVSDEGKGINPSIMENVFGYKYRGENLKKDGYGIGLSLVRQVTELCDGVAYVESYEGKGATFYMAFKALTLD